MSSYYINDIKYLPVELPKTYAILKLKLRGYTTKEIGKELSMYHKTVYSRINSARIKYKMNTQELLRTVNE